VLPDDPAYATVGGFVLDQLGFIPKGGESFEYGNFRFTVVEMDGKRVARVKIQLLPPASNQAEPSSTPTVGPAGVPVANEKEAKSTKVGS
jgi:putative hemolysin